MYRRLAAIAALMVALSLAAACGVGSPWFKTDSQLWAEIHEKYISEHPETGEAVKTAIRESAVIMGMTEPEVVAAIGSPERINRDTYSFGTRAQFCYDSGSIYVRPKYTFVYFENGRVTSWSQ